MPNALRRGGVDVDASGGNRSQRLVRQRQRWLAVNDRRRVHRLEPRTPPGLAVVDERVVACREQLVPRRRGEGVVEPGRRPSDGDVAEIHDVSATSAVAPQASSKRLCASPAFW